MPDTTHIKRFIERTELPTNVETGANVTIAYLDDLAEHIERQDKWLKVMNDALLDMAGKAARNDLYGAGTVQHLESKYITLECQRCGFYARVEGDSDLPKHSCATDTPPQRQITNYT